MSSPINGPHSNKYCRETQIVSAVIAGLVAGVAVAVILTHLQRPLGVAVPLGLLGGVELASLALFATATVTKRRLKKPDALLPNPPGVSTSERAPTSDPIPEAAPAPVDTPPPAPFNSRAQLESPSAPTISRHEILPVSTPSLTDAVQHREYWNTLLTPFFDALTNCLGALYRMHYASQNSPWRTQKDYQKWLEGWTAKDEKKIQDTLATLKDVLLRNDTFLTGANLVDSERLSHFCELINPHLKLEGTDLLYAAFLKACGYTLKSKSRNSLNIKEAMGKETWNRFQKQQNEEEYQDTEASYIYQGIHCLYERGIEVEQRQVLPANDPTAFFKVIFPTLLQEVNEKKASLLTLLQNGQKFFCNVPAAPVDAISNREFLSLLFDNMKSHKEKMAALTERLGEAGTTFLSLFAEQGGKKAQMIKGAIWTAVTFGGISPLLNCLGCGEPAIPGMSKQELKELITPIVVLFGMPLCHAVLDQENAFKDPIKQWIDRHYVDIVTNSYAPLAQATSVVGILEKATEFFSEAAKQLQDVTLKRYEK